jgi:hypothetical protein
MRWNFCAPQFELNLVAAHSSGKGTLQDLSHAKECLSASVCLVLSSHRVERVKLGPRLLPCHPPQHVYRSPLARWAQSI